jgi:hypothetical protein
LNGAVDVREAKGIREHKTECKKAKKGDLMTAYESPPVYDIHRQQT